MKLKTNFDMKFLIVIAVIVQLSLAEKTFTKVVQPPNDKLYPIFDLIATQMQEYNKIHYNWLAGIADEVVPAYKKFMETHNTNVYRDFNEAFLQALSTVEQFSKDPENCRLQRAAYIDVMRISELKPAEDDLKVFFRNFVTAKHLKVKEDKTAIRYIAKQFPDLIKNFIESLSEEEKQKNPELYNAAEEILKAAGANEKYNAIKTFMIKAQYDKNLAEANDENCKWDLTNFDVYVMTMLNRSGFFETD